MFKFLLASAATVYASADVGIPPGAVLENSLGSGDDTVDLADFTTEELELIAELEFSIDVTLSLPIVHPWDDLLADKTSVPYSIRSIELISFFEGDIANAIADTAAELDSVDVDFTHDCSDEGCSGTLATMLYKLIATGEDVLADIGGARSALTGGLDVSAITAAVKAQVEDAVTAAATSAIQNGDGALVYPSVTPTVVAADPAATEPCKPKNADGCCNVVKVISHGVVGVADPLELKLGTDGIYTTDASTHTLQLISGLTQFVQSDDLSNVLCYTKNRNTCLDQDVAYSCFKRAQIRGFQDRWLNNYDMKVECVNIC